MKKEFNASIHASYKYWLCRLILVGSEETKSQLAKEISRLFVEVNNDRAGILDLAETTSYDGWTEENLKRLHKYVESDSDLTQII